MATQSEIEEAAKAMVRLGMEHRAAGKPLPSRVEEAAAALEAVEKEAWKCGARQRHIGPEIQDCDWPVCGCDPYASKVLDAIAESGFKIVKDA